jgi:hypothetical protein
MEGKEQNLISIIIIAVFLLAPMIMKLLGKKFGVKPAREEDDKPDDSMHHPSPPEIPRPSQFSPEPGDHVPPPMPQAFSDKPIKPKWF